MGANTTPANVGVEDLVVDMTYVKNAIAENSAIIVDARTPMQYAFGHIETAINISIDVEDLEGQVKAHDLAEKEVVVYCSSAQCDIAERMTQKLFEMGLTRVKVYAGGWEEWELENF